MEQSINKSLNQNGRDHFFLEKASRAGGPVTCVAFSPLNSLMHSNFPSQPSFFFVGQGPYLMRYDTGFNGSSNRGCSVENRRIQTKEQEQIIVFPEDEKRPRGGGTIHGIHFLDYETNNFSCCDAIVYGGKRLAFCNLLGTGIRRQDVHQVFEDETETTTQPFMELDDWIWNVKTLHVKSSNDEGTKIQNKNSVLNRERCAGKTELTLVIGYARHMIEVWNANEIITETEDTIHSTRLRRIYLSPSTVVTAMDFTFVNERYQYKGTRDNENGDEVDSLWVAAGTSFHKIWVSSIPIGELLTSYRRGENYGDPKVDGNMNPSSINYKLLKGHSGVVHSVSWFQDGDRKSLASTSDDRSVRKWTWNRSQERWVESWVGWGHSARVWGVSTINSSLFTPDVSASSPSLPLLISVAEDGTARVWSSDSGETLSCIHHSTTLWTIDALNTVDGGMFVTGGTDGIAAIYNVCNHISNKNMLAIDDVAVPDDRPQVAAIDTGASQKEEVTQIKKKKKARKKTQLQVIVGVKCWRGGSTNSAQTVIVATRQGSLMSYDIQARGWKTCDAWCDQSIEEKFGIVANDGNCMAVHDRLPTVAIGTSRGDIVLTHFLREKKHHVGVLNARELRAVQGLSFLNSFCLASFHVHSVALWQIDFDVFPNKTVVEPTYILEVQTKGIPQSCAYDQVNQQVVVGDSRGNLVYFRINKTDRHEDEKQIRLIPTSVAHKVHQKQHITSIKWLGLNTILSAGNDGCVHVSYLNKDSIEKGWSYPAPSLTGISRIISSSMPTIVAGYHGNTYRILDIDSGYEYVRCDTGGRQRILDCSFNFNQENREQATPEYQLVVCKSQKDGSNNLFIQRSKQQPTQTVSWNNLATGVKLHGETVFDSEFFTLTNQEVVFLVTASEDCCSRISAWKNGRILDSVQLTPQESCCRCVTVSQIDDKSALLVVGGGKLQLQFFLIKEGIIDSKQYSAKNLEITFIGRGLISKKGVTIDHRINSIKAVPFLDSEDRSHIVIAGDSEGNSHAFQIAEANHQSWRDSLGLLVPTKGERPILCVEALVINERVLVLMGTTGGDIYLFDVPASLSRSRDSLNNFEGLWNPIGSYHGHQMGTNTICTKLKSLETVKGRLHATVSIISGGDDQALCVSQITLEPVDDCNDRLKLKETPRLRVVSEASFSAIKGVSYVHFCGQTYLVSVGYSQQLSIWRFGADDDMLLECVSRLAVDLGDVNCLSVYQSPDESACFVAVCGMGVEIFRHGNSTQSIL